MTDGVHHLAHDHFDLNARVLQLATRVRAPRGPEASTEDLAFPLRELRERLFHHFARVEEGVFPFVADAVPELAQRVVEMAAAHDAICGALARMCDLARRGTDWSALESLFDRFEAGYAAHAHAENVLLRELEQHLDAPRRRALAELVAGL